MAGNNSLELEVNNLFQEGYSLETICTEIISKYEKSDVLSPSEIESISHFLSSAGRVDLLFKFYLKCLRKESLGGFPWGSFAEAYSQLETYIPEDLIDIIEASLEEKKNYDNASMSGFLISAIPSLNEYLNKYREDYTNDRLQTKTKLISQLNHNRLYQLADQEELTLQQLIKMFPQDQEVKILHQAHLEKKADEILAKVRAPLTRKVSKKVIEATSPETLEFIENLRTHLLNLADKLITENPEQIYNLALLALQFDLNDLSLELINKSPKNFSSDWLKAEILFESSRYLDLLKHIETLEKEMSTSPEATYGALYLKAQAYFGLGQKEIAIQLLETLTSRVPHYRSAETLIHEWKNS